MHTCILAYFPTYLVMYIHTYAALRASASTNVKGADAMSVLERACKETATCHASSDPAGTLIVTCLVKLIPRARAPARGGGGGGGEKQLPAPAPKEPMQGVRGLEHLPAPADKEPMQAVPGG